MSALQDLRQTVARLRAPDGCPWDREQTHQSLAQYLIEEAAELLDTIDRLDMPHMREELGDVLLQVYLHAQIAEEAGQFDLEDVAAEINEKLIRRHPHVFSTDALETSAQVLKRWDEIKAAEKKDKPGKQNPLEDVPPALPALLYAHGIYKKATKQGLQLPSDHVPQTVAELASGLSEEAAGRMLFEIAAACKVAGIDPESALRRYARKIVEHS